MAEPLNREDFKDYCLRRLGWPLQQINITDDQIEDRVDDALIFYREYHYDGAERAFFKHQITQDDITNKYLEVPENIVEVKRLLPGWGNYATNWMTPQYQITLDAVWNLNATSLIPYHISMSHMAELAFMFDNSPSIRFNKHLNKLELNVNWDSVVAGDWLVFEADAYIDPETYADVWKDRWLKKYATALIKKQWGENVKAFTNIQLLGGITLDGQTIWQEADAEVSTLEQEMINSYSYPVMDMIG